MTPSTRQTTTITRTSKCWCSTTRESWTRRHWMKNHRVMYQEERRRRKAKGRAPIKCREIQVRGATRMHVEQSSRVEARTSNEELPTSRAPHNRREVTGTQTAHQAVAKNASKFHRHPVWSCFDLNTPCPKQCFDLNTPCPDQYFDLATACPNQEDLVEENKDNVDYAEMRSLNNWSVFSVYQSKA